jgi:hypothetical protein
MIFSGQSMKTRTRVSRCALVCLVSTACVALAGRAPAFGESVYAASPEGIAADPFAYEPLEGLGEAARVAEDARRASPDAFAAREASQTHFESLDSIEAARVADESFPAMIDETAGGPPRLSAGESIVGFPSPNTAQVDLGSGKRAVIDSLEPIAVESSPGHRVPVDLHLKEVGGTFVPSTPSTSVRIPKRLGSGVVLQGTGVTVTPVDSRGTPLAGSDGTLEGATVLYANTQADADTAVKPATLGVDVSTVLRSINSPRQLYFRLGVPAGAGVVQSGPSTAQVMDKGAVMAAVQPPTAVDAAGTPVPVSMKVSGSTLVLSVTDTPGDYQYPVYVDPTVTDKEIFYNPGQWLFLTNYPSVFKSFSGPGVLGDANELSGGPPYFAGDWGSTPIPLRGHLASTSLSVQQKNFMTSGLRFTTSSSCGLAPGVSNRGTVKGAKPR